MNTNEKFTISDIIFTQSRRGAPLVFVRGFKFYKQRVLGSKIRWQCAFHQKGCRASVMSFENRLIRCNNNHNHPLPLCLPFFWHKENMSYKQQFFWESLIWWKLKKYFLNPAFVILSKTDVVQNDFQTGKLGSQPEHTALDANH